MGVQIVNDLIAILHYYSFFYSHTPKFLKIKQWQYKKLLHSYSHIRSSKLKRLSTGRSVEDGLSCDIYLSSVGIVKTYDTASSIRLIKLPYILFSIYTF